MERLAKPLPLESPTVIELSPENKIRVTLFDANHCIGSVMFLIEGDGKAVLYTGDIRAETWWVNSLSQNPILLPYTLGPRRLDCVYLDTTFATKSEPYREFPSKAEGIRELLEKVQRYPDGTTFYFHAWTFGYENVWVALSNFLQSQIHLDEYRSRIYESISALRNDDLRGCGLEVREAPALCGFKNGNHTQPGCLTSQPSVRLHSCERGTGCPIVDQDTTTKIVHIIPIVTRANGTEIAEVGAGGGQGDLDLKEQLETTDAADVSRLMALCSSEIGDQQLRGKVLSLFRSALDHSNDRIDLGISMQRESQGGDDDVSLQTLIDILLHRVAQANEINGPENRAIRFPYSRHSSYSELCTLINALKPRDVYPCTVDDENWTPSIGMRTLFASYCSADIFRHDSEMMEAFRSRMSREVHGKRAAGTQASIEDQGDDSPVTRKRICLSPEPKVPSSPRYRGDATQFVTPVGSPAQDRPINPVEASKVGLLLPPPTQLISTTQPSPIATLQPDIYSNPRPSSKPACGTPTASSTVMSAATKLSTRPPRSVHEQKPKMKNRQIAYNAALGFGLTWADYGGLVSTKTQGADDEQEL